MPRQTLTDRDHDLLFGDDALEPGDAVVHFEHGLARYDGEEECDLGDAHQTLTTFVYRNGGKMMLPAEEGHDFWRFGAPADTLTLDRLKSDDWVRRRDEMIVELRQSADRMVELDRARKAAKASALVPDAKALAAFADGFGHEPTEDQERAIAAVLEDLGRQTPMDRLLVGDVGFGKTEVGLRAAAAAALSGHQVVLAAPTTVLARQHYTSFAARFEGTGVSVAELSRLTGADDRRAVLDGLASGEIGVVIGTQTLLDDALSFDALALVIIDEEQRFGEEQKDKLRHLASGVHVLSMTATPIPRSLAAAEVGLVDVSVVATAPKSRKPVETRLGVLDEDTMLAAIARETARDGQCYLVCPRIAGVERMEALLKERKVDFSYVVAHGQMTDEDMADAMLRFMAGEVDVLLSTSIIESGLDNGRANTMIVWNAERFGLSQLHQLRGRIGRSQLPAHMLLMTDMDTDDDSDAAARLNAFSRMSEIGAGFRIARKDRDIRGFGALDGTEQSGQMSRLGIGLYRHVLKNHVEAIDG
ncbi:DEAD/DEAH box helicase [Salipiger sp. IMCC34102]|uniref:DEAD/DEAH box helicase n=1 Tax=Salipiger sp. IMCC34102 TaxID=2510647 RepID=UPI0013EDF727|nr:DEAD/DEAH box helicase [Salipiger sp. IMCC34102]